MFRKKGNKTTADKIIIGLEDNLKERNRLMQMANLELEKLTIVLSILEKEKTTQDVEVEKGPEENKEVEPKDDTKKKSVRKIKRKRKHKDAVGKEDLFICAKCLKIFDYKGRFKHYEERKTHRPVAHIPSLLGERGGTAKHSLKTRIKDALKNTRYSYEDVVRKAEKATGKKEIKVSVEPKRVRDIKRKKSHYHKMKNMPRVCLECEKIFTSNTTYKQHYKDTQHKPIVLIDAIERKSHQVKQPLRNYGYTIEDAAKIVDRVVKNYSRPEETQKGSHDNYAVTESEIDGLGYVCLKCDEWFPRAGVAQYHSIRQDHKPVISISSFERGSLRTLASIKDSKYTRKEVSDLIDRVLKNRKYA